MIIPPKNEELAPNESPEVKEARRAMIAEKTAEFLASKNAEGKPNKIQPLPSCTFSKDADCAAWADLDLRKPTEKDGPKNKEKAAPDLELHKRVKV